MPDHPSLSPALARIIDANANRAREALRVMEDAARFGLNHADLCGLIKNLRHDLTAALERCGIDRGQLLAARDTQGDVGTSIEGPAEYDRADLRSVAAAAGGRLTEALRSIEEAVKAAGGGGGGSGAAIARAVESLRYRAYTIDKQLSLAFGVGGSAARQWRLCVLITASLCKHHSWDAVARMALDGGADCLQLREKRMPCQQVLEHARKLVEIAHGAKAAAIINDRPDVARLSGADGVHLGQEDLPIEEVRRLVGFELLIGVSTSRLDQATRAVQAGADYCGVGPMFPSKTKYKPKIVGPAYLREYLADDTLERRPHLAIGGITPENIGQLAAAGCRGVAVSACVIGATEPAKVCQTLREALE